VPQLDAEKKSTVLKMARENAPKMLQNYKEQKHIIQQKHIEILQKKKDEAKFLSSGFFFKTTFWYLI
jgi:uncharacterized protein YciI